MRSRSPDRRHSLRNLEASTITRRPSKRSLFDGGSRPELTVQFPAARLSTPWGQCCRAPNEWAPCPVKGRPSREASRGAGLLNDVKERDAAAGAVVTSMRAHAPGTCANAHAGSAHGLGLDVVRLGLRAICPPALAAEGRPCAGYSGFNLEPWLARSFILEEKPQ